ncbi:MAG: hypothetical protein K6G13_08920 [Agathobacter sp.]|uniref:radical SAM protein n=1 Tax=Agathobacter sp. TaxID=2021311 RepID=UPI00258BAD43|nr:radical SAM protein [Agathobacter sp.]MCR5678137.1 hypothetical protein [Agathobacter sp.]
MKLCDRAIEFVQIMNEDGAVRQCSWLKDGGIIGYLTQNSLDEIYHSKEAQLIRDMHCREDYSNCNPNTCPFVANNTVAEHMIEIEEVPRYPYSLYLAYENVCNYKCAMCGIPGCMANKDAKITEEKYNRIDAEIRKALPYIKHISANGLGELFVSKHTLQLLSEWEPLADPSEVTVSLETNGSLFDEAHWSQIANLGKYKLFVAITVLSFENEIYQELSGTRQPVEKLIENLKFVKGLREQGIINRLEIATVYQNGNFRQLPDFARRCVEEFGADYVRLRPFEPWGEVGMKEWFMDVRNVYHPNHKEFLEVMKDPIFSHPKVHDWGGGRESGLGPEPYVKTRTMFSHMEKIFEEDFVNCIKTVAAGKKLVIYGMTVVGKALVSRLKDEFEIAYCLDRKMDGSSYSGVPIYGLNHFETLEKDVCVIVSLHWIENTIKEMLMNAGYPGPVIGISELCGD